MPCGSVPGTFWTLALGVSGALRLGGLQALVRDGAKGRATTCQLDHRSSGCVAHKGSGKGCFSPGSLQPHLNLSPTPQPPPFLLPQEQALPFLGTHVHPRPWPPRLCSVDHSPQASPPFRVPMEGDTSWGPATLSARGGASGGQLRSPKALSPARPTATW